MKLTPTQKRWLAHHHKEYPVICKLCISPVAWQASRSRYGTYCSSACAHKDKLCQVNKAKATLMQKYGVDSPLKNETILAKVRHTNLKKYGVEWNSTCTSSVNKRQQTCISKYGSANPFGSIIIQDKIRRIFNEKYGCHPRQTAKVQDKYRTTSIEKYEVQNHSQLHISTALPLLLDRTWLAHQYLTLNKTATQLAAELQLSDATVGNYLRMHQIAIRQCIGFSYKCLKWLMDISTRENIYIQHAGNIGEFNIPHTRYKADGYCKSTNTIYEFHGDIFHGNPNIFQHDKLCHPYSDLTAGQLYARTKHREGEIRQLGYNLVIMWENDFNSDNI